ncbi:hypothetical protein J4P90_17740 [Bacillus sp. SY8(2021)]|uniref:Uncharacterized protein n=1 Tax=Bacillus arachidis TaxID=2819290 RepID=A0ABS3P1F9_9BACI|nr:hypothetical protein [Bacillus arachidis]MBO1627042.1 hypothetical protein [Bacillus arachidis]
MFDIIWHRAVMLWGIVTYSAGSSISLGYYIIVTITIWGMSQLYTRSLIVMPLYFLILVIVMTVVSRMFIYNSKVIESV